NMFERIDDDYLNGIIVDFVDRERSDLIGRWSKHHDWWNGRASYNIDPYSKSTSNGIKPETQVRLRDGRPVEGVNFSSQDYLSLASHPAVHAAAKQAIDAFGVHSAGSAALMGNTTLSRALEARFAAFLGYADCTLFPTGWGAGYGVIRALVSENDH